MDIRKYINDKKKFIDKALDRYLPSPKVKPQSIHEAMRYAVFPGGKRIRPVLTLASFEACGGKGDSIMPIACAIELIHSYTLIHDDLPCMDNDDYRRGRPSCHKKFSEALALLAGDALLTLAFHLLSESGNMKVINEISRAVGSSGTIGGQVVDIETMGKKRNKQDLDYITSHKTGRLFEISVKAAGLYKGIGEKKIKALGDFGRHIGFTFQLVDDLVDRDGSAGIYGDSHVRKMAGLLTKRAKACLDVFGKKASRLTDIADLILERRS